MRQIYVLLLCMASLTGCLKIGATNLCAGCFDSSDKRKAVVEEMKTKYPINAQLIDTMDGDTKYTVKEHTKKYDGLIAGSGNILADIITLPITVGLGVPLHLLGVPIGFDYGMVLTKHGTNNDNGKELFVSYSTIKSEYPTNGTKKYNLLTPTKYSEYQKAKKEATEIAERKRVEAQKKEQKRQAQKMEQLQRDIADCEQAYNQAAQKARSFSDSDLFMKDSVGCELVVNNKGECGGICTRGAPRVTDFAKKGVFIDDWAFVYTSDTDYATGERIRHDNLIYKKVGNYKYKTVTGATQSVPAYEATTTKNYEIMLSFYLNNKKLSCCQYLVNGKWTVGVIDSSRSSKCKTNQHPLGKTGSRKCTF